jgi:hypothetical protein
LLQVCCSVLRVRGADPGADDRTGSRSNAGATAAAYRSTERRKGWPRSARNWHQPRFQLAVFGINGPISDAPPNTVWFREAKVEFFR